MAETKAIHRRSGFSPAGETFHSLRPAVPLPDETEPLSFTTYALSLLPSPLPRHPALIDAATAAAVSYPQFVSQIQNLAASLNSRLGLSIGHVAFVLSPASIEIPVLYLALLSLGAVVCPANPASSAAEISRHIRLSNPFVAFATSCTAAKLPRHVTTVLLDTPQFSSFLGGDDQSGTPTPVEIRQSDAAAIQFSSGTTGPVKAAAIPHRSFIAMSAGFYALKPRGSMADVTVLVAPMFHSVGFFFALNAAALGETLVVLGRYRLGKLLGAAARHRATQIVASPPVVAEIARSEEEAAERRLDLDALERVVCGGAPLPVVKSELFMARLPKVDLCMAYGATEAGGISRMIGREECHRLTSVGRLSENVEAKIVDTVSGKSLSTHQKGELWIRGPAVMTGYIGDQVANASVFNSDGWLRTGDLCYFDDDGFLFIVDRLKELIKYKAYQVPPAELEQLLQSLHGVVDAAVVPYPHEEAGQIPMAFVVRQPGSNLSEAQVIDFVAKQVAPYKKIRKVAFINSIPKSAAGKILRKELANQVLGGFVSSL